MPTPIRIFDVDGTDDQAGQVAAALDRCSIDPTKFIRGRIAVTFPTRLPKRPDGGPAEAFSRLKARRIVIRPRLRDRRTQYLFLHEVGHFVDSDSLTNAKRTELMRLMSPQAQRWLQGEYMEMPCECFADAFAGAISDMSSPHEHFYTRDIPSAKLPKLIDIVLRAERSESSTPVDVKPQPPTLDDLLEEIVRVESSGRPLAQNSRTGASGLYGFMPRFWRVIAPRVLRTDAALAVATRDQAPSVWRPELSEDNQHAVARSEFRRLSRRFEGDLQKVAASWRNGEGFVSRTPVSQWTRGLVKYVNATCQPLGFPALRVQNTSNTGGDEPGPIVEESPVPVNVVAHQVGFIRAGTKVFYPTPDHELTTLRVDADAAQLVGETEDGKFRFVIVESKEFPGGTAANRIRGLALVPTDAVTRIRVEPPAGIDPLELEDLRRQRDDLADQVATLGQMLEKVEAAIQDAAERLRAITG